MDAECYVIEQMIRDRIAEARATAQRAALIRQSKGHSRDARSAGSWLMELGRSLAKGVREGTVDLARVWHPRKPVPKRS
jgi:hypothetical protein